MRLSTEDRVFLQLLTAHISAGCKDNAIAFERAEHAALLFKIRQTKAGWRKYTDALIQEDLENEKAK